MLSSNVARGRWTLRLDGKTLLTAEGIACARTLNSKDERYRVSTYFREELEEGLDMRLNLDVLSDISMLSDWFRRDYRRMEQPRS